MGSAVLRTCALLALVSAAAAVTRTHYLSIDLVDWDYAPALPNDTSPATNQCYGRAYDEAESLYVSSEGGLVGTVYKKAVFRGYTSAAFSTLADIPPEWTHLGMLGPPMHVEVGDTLKVVVRNTAPFDFELAVVSGLGRDATGPGAIAEGEVGTYTFDVPADAGPDPSAHGASLMHFYSAPQPAAASDALYAGLLGPVIVTRKGEARPDGTPADVDRELVSVLWIADENASPLWEDFNAELAGEGDVDEGDFEESNRMHVVNGYSFCTVPNISLETGKTTRWYSAAVGNEADLHSLHWHGIVGITSGGMHTDSVRMLPGTSVPVDFVPDNPGRWLGHCHVGLHLEHAGMLLLYDVTGEPVLTGLEGPPTKTRKYFIQAEDSVWDYAPDGTNICDDAPFGDDENIFVQEHFAIEDDDDVIGYGVGSKYVKTRYVEYTDATFTTPIPVRPDMGVMGPVIRGRVGEDIVIHFKNNCSDYVSLHTHGLFYLKDGEGAPYADGTSGGDVADDMIPPGEDFTYLWQANERSGPGPGEKFESKLWMYHSHRNEVTDTYAGLFGVVLVIAEHATGYDDETLLPTDGSDEVFLHFSVMNEGESYHIGENAIRDPSNRNLSSDALDELLENDDFVEGNLMHAINGFMYCNGPQIQLQVGRPAYMYMYSLGSDVDFHSVSLDKTVLHLDEGATRGSAKLLAGTFATAKVTPVSSGALELRCSIDDHIAAGMRTLVNVTEAEPGYFKTLSSTPKAKTFYIAADEVEWDYASTDTDQCTGEDFGDDQRVFTEPSDITPGSKYVKAMYKQYTDASYSHAMETSPSFSGIVGPLLHLEAGGTFELVLKNNLDFPVNLIIAGFEIVESTADIETEGVGPGEIGRTTWRITTEAAPKESDLSSVAFVYFSSVDSIAHAHAGLVGAVTVSKQGSLSEESGLPPGCSKAVPLLFNIFRENASPFIEKSLEKFALSEVPECELEELQEDDDWLESNAMHSVNGYLYCNNPSLVSKRGDVVRFVVFGYGSEASMHSPFFGGQIIGRSVRRGTSAGGVQIFPYTAEVVDIVMTETGLRPTGCLVVDHVVGGMAAKIEVVE